MLALAVIALAAGVAFYLQQRRAPNPLYDLEVAARPTFWVAACAGIIVFGSLMGAMFVGQQFLQNVLGYSTLEAGLAILPAAAFMVRRRAAFGEARRGAQGAGSRCSSGYVFCLLGFLTMLLLWKEDIAYWKVGLGYAFVGIGVGFAGTPASHSLTGSVPVQRAGMASGTADLQRDLGGAIMQSIFGALLTAGYAAAVGGRDRRLRQGQSRQRPEPADEVVRRRRGGRRSSTRSTPIRSPRRRRRRSSTATSGRTRPASSRSCSARRLVFLRFPKHEEEEQLLASYHAQDTERRAGAAETGEPVPAA